MILTRKVRYDFVRFMKNMNRGEELSLIAVCNNRSKETTGVHSIDHENSSKVGKVLLKCQELMLHDDLFRKTLLFFLAKTIQGNTDSPRGGLTMPTARDMNQFIRPIVKK